MKKTEWITSTHKEAIKRKSWRKLNSSPLMLRLMEADDVALRALLVGYWPFVDSFPRVIRLTYEATAQFSRYGRVLSGALREMETDERNHRALWLRSTAAADIPESDLTQSQALPEVLRVTDAMVEREALWQRLLDFVAVEIVAEGLSVALLSSNRFCERLGKKGTAWFKVHALHPSDETTHEEIAYRAAVALMPKDGAEAIADQVDRTIQETVDRFVEAMSACFCAQDALALVD